MLAWHAGSGQTERARNRKPVTDFSRSTPVYTISQLYTGRMGLAILCLVVAFIWPNYRKPIKVTSSQIWVWNVSFAISDLNYYEGLWVWSAPLGLWWVWSTPSLATTHVSVVQVHVHVTSQAHIPLL